MPSEFTTFRRHVLSLPGRSSPERQKGCNVLDGRRRYRDGELGTDVNLIRKEPDCGGSGMKQKVLIRVPAWRLRYGIKDGRSVLFPYG